MAVLSELKVRITGDSASLTKSIKAAEGRMQKFKGVGEQSVRGRQGRRARAGGDRRRAQIVGFGAAIFGSVKSVIELEKELRPMVERSGLAAESLQALTEAAKRAGSEDGLEGVTDAAQELQLRLAEAATMGSGAAVDALDSLGLIGGGSHRGEPRGELPDDDHRVAGRHE